jgi:hypothetical protein
MNRARRLLGLTVAVGLLAQLCACSIQPWVKPYERERLADPIMSFDPNPVDSGAARGGNGAAGGGCGCN